MEYGKCIDYPNHNREYNTTLLFHFDKKLHFAKSDLAK